MTESYELYTTPTKETDDLGGPGPVYICRHCWSHIQSENRWNMVTCSCGKSAVDGGDTYTKVSFSEIPPDPLDTHAEGCDAWKALACTCPRRWDDYADDEYPARISKSAKPKMGVDNKGIFTVARKMLSRYGKKK